MSTHEAVRAAPDARAALPAGSGDPVAAATADALGAAIARGDLAIEAGYERLAEVQEEVLWLAAAAHLPVVWATQVLETLAKSGQPTRAEITDAAMAERAEECVMSNKGPHVTDAAGVLKNLLRRMPDQQSKKVVLLRRVQSWPAAALRDA